jgi:L-lactate dehydrogenase complex protein LldG
LPFITEHLVLIVRADNIVDNMLEAYQRIQLHETGFGVFISGPSKTADIEQSLVYGAHGAVKCTAVLVTGAAG